MKRRLNRLGVPYILLAKLMPGAPAAGLACFRALAFPLTDGVSLVLWGTLYAGIGWIFQSQVESAIGWVLAYSRGDLAVGIVLILAAAAWRMRKAALHRRAHRRAERPGVPEGRQPTVGSLAQ